MIGLPPALVLRLLLPMVYVVLPGQSALVDELFGKGAALPGGCTLRSTSVQQEDVRGVYDCATVKGAVIALLHPSLGPPSATRTLHFAVVPMFEVTPALERAVIERVRAHEASWRWSREDTVPIDAALTAGRSEWGTMSKDPLPARMGARWRQARKWLHVDWNSDANLARERWAALGIASSVPLAVLWLLLLLATARRKAR